MGKPFEIRREVELAGTPEQVWPAIATGDGLAAWFMPMELDSDSPNVTNWEPGRRLGVRTPPGDDGSFQLFDYRLEAAGPQRTALRFSHSGFTGEGFGDDFEEQTGAGWDMYLHTLAQYLIHFPGHPALYLEAEAPPASADPGAWARLVGALGLSDPVALGAPVRLDLPGVGPVQGTVDYATGAPGGGGGFIGLRAPLALIRFHGRGAMGMPVAVSQHTYVATFDVGSAQRGWEAWLSAVFRAGGGR